VTKNAENITVNNGSGYNAKNLTLNMAAVGAIIVTTIGLGLFLSEEKKAIYDLIGGNKVEADQKFNRVINALDSLKLAVEALNTRTSDRYTRRDAAYHCALAALANPGHICVNPLAPDLQILQVGLGKWKTSTTR